MNDLQNYPIVLTRINNRTVKYEAFYPDLSYVEIKGLGLTVEEALSNLKKNAEKTLKLYQLRNIRIPDPSSNIDNVNSIKDTLNYIYIGRLYTSYLIHNGGL